MAGDIVSKIASKLAGSVGKGPSRVIALYEGPLVYVNEEGAETPFFVLPEQKPLKASDPRTVKGRIDASERQLEVFVRAIRAGNTQKAALALAGLGNDAFHKWRKIASSEPPEDETPEDKVKREYLKAFFDAVEIASSLAEREWFDTVAAAAAGRLKPAKKKLKETIQFVNKAGDVVNTQIRTVEEEIETPPDPKVAMWMLERRGGKEYLPKKEAQVTVEGGIGVTVEGEIGIKKDPIDEIHDIIRAIAQNQGALPQPGTEPVPGDEDDDDDVMDAEFQETTGE